MKIILIVGLPCSGKTTYAKTLDGLLIDDPINFYEDVVKPIEGKNPDVIIITDPYLIYISHQIRAEILLQKTFPNCKIEWLFFENDPIQCLTNLKTRIQNGDFRNVKNMILLGSKEYYIPENARIFPVWRG